MLSETDIQKFQEIYKKYYGKEIGKEDACREASNLLRMLKVIAETLGKKDVGKENNNPE